MQKFLLTVLLLLSLAQFSRAQRQEIGFGIGTFNYTGDLVRTYDFGNSKIAATALYRSNISRVISFRAGITAGKIGAAEKPIDPFAVNRNASFDVFLMEVAVGAEYHFLDWKDDKHPLRYTPYVFAGLGLFGISGAQDKPTEYSNVQGSFPFGLGFKYVVNPKWYVALELGMRKTFFDYLDNVSDGDQTDKNYRYGNPFDNDNYFFLGLTFTRTFYDIPCPTNPYK